jgi:hypothetical protein
MSAFTVELTNRPGQLAELCEVMAARNINIVLTGIAHGDSGAVAFIVDDEAATRTALEDAGISFTERPALTVRLDNVPGTAAATFRALAKAEVNVEVLLPVRVSDEYFFAVICAADLDAARQALGDRVVTG